MSHNGTQSRRLVLVALMGVLTPVNTQQYIVSTHEEVMQGKRGRYVGKSNGRDTPIGDRSKQEHTPFKPWAHSARAPQLALH